MPIRELRISDVPAILEMAKREEGFHVSQDAPYFWSQKQLENWINMGWDVLLGAQEDGRLVGFVLTAIHVPTGKVTWENEFVLPEYRRQGIGEALAKEMRERLKACGARYLVGFVRTDNLNALAYYMRKIGLTRGYDFAWLEENL